MKRNTLIIGGFFLSGIFKFINGTIVLFSSLPALQDHFQIVLGSYWPNRLMGALYLGVTGMYFNALIILIGAYLMTRKDSYLAGKLILLASIIPSIVSSITLPLLTPEDSFHMIFHVLIIILIGGGLLLFKEEKTR